MKTLTKKQRHEIYLWMIEHFREYSVFLCNNLTFGHPTFRDSDMCLLDEFNMFKPTDLIYGGEGWWNYLGGAKAYYIDEVIQHQLTILEFCVEMTK